MGNLLDAFGRRADPYLRKTGGDLLLFDPVADMEAATKRYVDSLAFNANNLLDFRRFGTIQLIGRGTVLQTDGMITAPGATGTASAVNDANGSAVNYASTTLLSAIAGINATSNDYQLANLPDAYIVMRTGAAATDIQNCRIWVLFVTSTGLGVSIPPNMIGFTFNVVERSDVNWQVATSDAAGGPEATNFKRTDTGIAVTADTRYRLRIQCVSTTQVKFYINDVVVATHTNQPMPAATTALLYGIYIINGLAGTARNIRFTKWHTLSL